MMPVPLERSSSSGTPTLARAALAAAGILAAGCVEPQDRWEDLAAVPVRSETAAMTDLEITVRLWGRLLPPGKATVGTLAAGTVDYPDRFGGGLRTGSEVSEGETLAIVEDGEAASLLAQARIADESARAVLERQRRGREAGVVPESVLQEAEIQWRLAQERLRHAERSLEQAVLRAPAHGILQIETVYPPGSHLPAGTPLGEIVLRGAPRFEAWAAASDAERLAPGLPVSLFRPGATEPVGEGSLTEVSPVVDEAGTVRIVGAAADGAVLPRPGEGVDVVVRLPTRQAVITIPEESVVLGSRGPAVYVLQKHPFVPDRQRALQVEVGLGARSGGRVEVTSGLGEGDRVVVAGMAFLTPNAVVHDARGGGTGSAQTAP